LIKKTRKDTQLKIYKATAVPTLTYGSQIWITKKEEAKIERAEMKFLWSVVGYTRKDQIRNKKIREKVNIFNPNKKILKSRSHWNTTCNNWKPGGFWGKF
jgi:hypothetical protein